MAVFVEWLRATGAMAEAEPGRVMGWAAGRSAAFDAAMKGFMGGTLGRARGVAVVRWCGGVREAWGYEDLPGWALARLEGADAVDLAVFHLLERNTRPDDRVLWMGTPDDALPLGALYFGATVILADAPSAALAAAEGAILLRPRP